MLVTAADHAPAAGWTFAVALVVLLGIAVGASWRGRLRLERALVTAAVRALLQLVAVAAVTAAVRALLQLVAVAAVIAAVLEHAWASLLFAALMFAVAVGAAAGRDEAHRSWPWIGMALGTAETTAVVASQRLIADGRILPADVRELLPAR